MRRRLIAALVAFVTVLFGMVTSGRAPAPANFAATAGGCVFIFFTLLACQGVLLNVLHLGVWFVCLWLLLRFQWSHALGLAAAVWLVLTLTFLPPLLQLAAA